MVRARDALRLLGGAVVGVAVGCSSSSSKGGADSTQERDASAVADGSAATDSGGVSTQDRDASAVVDGAAATDGGGDGGGGDAAFVPSTVGSVTTVENLGAFPAQRAAKGLGFNLDVGAEWEFKAAHDAGATRGRLQCSWDSVETQSAAPQNTSSGYALPSSCQQSLTLAKQYDLSLTWVAAFGPPFHPLVQVALAADAPAGATTLSLTLTGGGSLSSVAYPYAYLASATGAFLSPKHSYPGTLITGGNVANSTHATVTLASALTTALASGTPLTINQVLYPSPATDSPTDASIVAYTKYVQYLGSQCAAAGVACEIELWNEPPWPDDCWDNRIDCYDTSPGYDQEASGPNWGIAAALQSTTPATGATYTWAGTNKSGDNSLLKPAMQQYTGVAFAQPNAAIAFESLHPYGNNPEDSAWNGPCLAAAVANGTNPYLCNFVQAVGSNAFEPSELALQSRQTKPSANLGQSITETGQTSLSGADEVHKARFVLRQYLAFLAAGVSYIEFYRLYEMNAGGVSGFSFVLPTSGLGYTPLASFTTMAGLVSDVATVAAAPLAPYAADGTGLVTVASYSGTYPLDIVQLVGARAGDAANSLLLAVYQRSVTTGTCSQDGSTPCWSNLASPAPTAATLTLPAGLTVAKVVNLVTRGEVPSAVTGASIELEVSDDPVEILLVP